jgi:DNA invertase Pin-like site-specific DNA recombinase
MKGVKMTVYFYGRNSDSESFERNSSIQTQLSKCKSYANIKDLKIDVEITEQVSGTTCFERRQKGSELISNLKRGDHIIC